MLVVCGLVAFCLSRLLFVLLRSDIGFVEDAWAGDSGVVFDGVGVFLLFFDFVAPSSVATTEEGGALHSPLPPGFASLYQKAATRFA